MVMNLARVGAMTAPTRLTWTPSECALYALALGAGVEEPAFTVDTDSPGGQLVYPTFVLAGILAADSAHWPDPALQTGDYGIAQLVLGEQSLRWHGVVPPRGDVQVVNTIAAIYDKGTGALVVIETAATDNRTRQALLSARTGIFVIGGGGFGGERGGGGPQTKPPDREPNARLWYPTAPAQTLLYRYAGNDRNPIHADATVAAQAGYRAPILMGQNTLGFAGRALVHTVAGGDPTRLRSLAGRFAEAGYNGDVLAVEIWAGDDVGADEHGDRVVMFRVRNQHGAVLIDRGRATVR